MLQGTLNSQHYSNPHFLTMLASFALRAEVSSKKNRSIRIPLIASASYDQNTCIVIGIPPITESLPKR